MSDILGYDVNGEPLRAGDRVVPVGMSCCHAEAPPSPWTVARLSNIFAGEIVFKEKDLGGDDFCGASELLVKLKDDSQSKDGYTDQHKPCGLSFHDMMKGLRHETINS